MAGGFSNQQRLHQGCRFASVYRRAVRSYVRFSCHTKQLHIIRLRYCKASVWPDVGPLLCPLFRLLRFSHLLFPWLDAHLFLDRTMGNAIEAACRAKVRSTPDFQTSTRRVFSPRKLKLGSHSGSGETERMCGNSWRILRMATRPSSRASWFPMQK